jgi:ribose 1,5-bisphosphokinase
MCSDERRIVFPRRIVTRPSSDAEDHDTASPEEFDGGLAAGRFAVCWNAHGLRYALPVSMDSDIGAGRCVICNVSRTIIPELRKRYVRVLTILVTAPLDILTARLAARGRGTDGSLAERLARSTEIDRNVAADMVIENAGPLDEGARKLYGVIQSQFVLISI